ncbi:MAG: hypothetical protein WB680_22535 [Candidatus Acidiferrales bacterium]
MTRPDLFQKLSSLLDIAEREKMFGTIEFEVRSGKITLLRTVKTEKIEDEGNNSHAKQTYR